jgi:ubiquinone/menaquinone biosynthesis C-methylase UbiE
MTLIRYEIRDRCRKQLTKYLLRAISMVPPLNLPLVLDMGCGTGVPSIALSQHLNCKIHAVDADRKAVEHFRRKITELNLSERIILYEQSVFKMNFPDNYFDLVIAEGLLNVIGFKTGLSLAGKYMKEGGYFIIHDAYQDHNSKQALIQKLGYALIGSFVLDEQVWWNEYYHCLEMHLQNLGEDAESGRFNDDRREIEQYRERPGLFRSIYYVLLRPELNT